MLLKYGRSQRLFDRLPGILELLKIAVISDKAGWLKAINVYVLAVNKFMEAEEFRSIVEHVFPTQIEAGSIADRLLKKGQKEGRAEGREEGRVEGIQEGLQEGLARGEVIGSLKVLCGMLGEAVPSEHALKTEPLESLVQLVEKLQQRLRDR